MDGDQTFIIQFYILIFHLTQSWQMTNKNLNVPAVSWHEFRAMLPHCGLIFPCQMSEEVPEENENCVCTEYKCIWQKRTCVRQRLYVIWAQGLRRERHLFQGVFCQDSCLSTAHFIICQNVSASHVKEKKLRHLRSLKCFSFFLSIAFKYVKKNNPSCVQVSSFFVVLLVVVWMWSSDAPTGLLANY